MTRSDTGNTLRDPGRFVVTVDLTTGYLTIRGLYWNIVYPGVGQVYHSVGRSVFTGADLAERIFMAGHSDFAAGKDLFEEVCTALA